MQLLQQRHLVNTDVISELDHLNVENTSEIDSEEELFLSEHEDQSDNGQIDQICLKLQVVICEKN